MTRALLLLMAGALGGCSPVGYVVLGSMAFSSSSKGDGEGRPLRLIVSPGLNHPVSTEAYVQDLDVPLVQLALRAEKTDAHVSSLRFQASGSGDDLLGLPRVRLLRDVDGDALVGPWDVEISDTQTFSADDGEVFFLLDETVPAEMEVHWMLVYDVGPGPAPGETFCAEIVDDGDVEVSVRGRPARAQVQSGTQGCITTRGGALDVSLGPASPPAREVGPCSTDVVLLQIRIAPGLEEGVVVDSVTFAAAGTGDDAADISALRLFADEDGDGLPGPGDTPLGVPTTFSGDDGRATFDSLFREVPASASETWILVGDMAGSIPVAGTYRAGIASNQDLLARGTESLQGVPVAGAPLEGEEVTAADVFLAYAVFEDMDESSHLSPGDTVTIGFSQEVTLSGSPVADEVLHLDPAGTFGWGALVSPGGSASELIVTLGDRPLLEPNGVHGTDAGSHGLNLAIDQDEITDAHGCIVRPLAGWIDLGGELNPRVVSVSFTDSSRNCLADAGDVVELRFTGRITLTTSIPGDAFELPVAGDFLGTGAQFAGGGMPSNVDRVAIVLGSSAILQPDGFFDPAVVSAGSPSGIDVSALAGAIVDADHPSVPAVPLTPPGLDISGIPTLIWSVEGDQDGASFGSTVAAAGDVNGDGLGDILVGTSSYDSDPASGLTDQGRAYLFLAGPGGVSAVPSWTSAGEDQAGAYFGVSVASAGDVNGDGFDDIMVGASRFDTPNVIAGKSYLYHGSTTGPGASPDWTSSGEDQGGATFGVSVASAGDVDNDGFADVIIGASGYDTANNGAGKCYLYLGSASGLSSTAAWTSSGDDQAMALFGSPVTSAGDVNGDGFSDLLVAAVYHDTLNADVGKVYLFLGGDPVTVVTSTPTWSSVGDDQGNARFGYSIDSAGDVDGDGFSDVIIGAREYDTPTISGAGKAYVYLGGDPSTGLESSPAWTSSGSEMANGYFGESVASAGDVNGDGYSDIVVGQPRGPSAATGTVFVHLGGDPTTVIVDLPYWTGSGDSQRGQQFGRSVAGAGDVNGNGYAEILIGSPPYDSAIWSSGKAYLYCLNR